MPRIKNIELKFENRTDPSDSILVDGLDLTQIHAVVKFKAYFNEDEKHLNLNYSFSGYLLERDGSLDKYIVWPNGTGINIQRAPVGNRDDFITWFTPNPIRIKPDNRNKVNLEM